MPTILITGVTGQIGSFLADLYLSDSWKVIGLKRRSATNALCNIEHCLSNENFIMPAGDLTDMASLMRVINTYRPDQIANAAAQSFVWDSFGEPSHTIDVTGKGVLNLLESIRLLRTESYNPRFVQFSSSEMFGDQFDVDEDGNKYQDEQTRMNPQSPYAVAKLMGYHLVKLYRQSYGIWAANAICFNTESTRRGEQFVTRKITKWLGQFNNWREQHGNLSPRIDATSLYIDGHTFPKLRLGNIEAHRDWNYALDTANGVKMLLGHHSPDDIIFSSGESHSVRSFVKLAFSLIGIENWLDYIVTDCKFFRPSEVPFLCGRASKAYEVLGWKPQFSFLELVKLMVKHDVEKARLPQTDTGI